MTNAILRGKPDAGNPHVRFDEGEVASAKPRRGSLLYELVEIRSKMLVLRNQAVLLDRDVAAIYDVQTKEVNQAVRNNPDKFPDGFVFRLNADEFRDWKSKILTSNLSPEESQSLKMGIRRAPFAFTERGLYMLATILKGAWATAASLAIVNTYAQVRAMVYDMEALQSLKDGSPEQAAKLTQVGHKLAALIGDNLSTETTKTTIELNLAVVKITHEVTRAKKRK